MWTLLRFACLLAALAGPGAALADEDGDHDDHDRARAALRAGRVLPLETVVERVNRDFPGDILDVEFEEEHGRFVYEIKTITTDGRILKLEYDAATGDLLGARGRRRGHGREGR